MHMERGAYGQILVYPLEITQKLCDFQQQILSSQATLSVLPYYIREQNKQIEICFDCTDCLSLKQLESRFNYLLQPLSRTLAPDLLLTLVSLQNLFLNPDNIFLKSAFIFYNIKNERLCWCYLPIKSSSLKSKSLIKPSARHHLFSKNFIQNLETLFADDFFQQAFHENEISSILDEIKNTHLDSLIHLLHQIKLSNTPISPNTTYSFHNTSKFILALSILFFCSMLGIIIKELFFPLLDIPFIEKQYFPFFIITAIFITAIYYFKVVKNSQKEICYQKPPSVSTKTSRELYFPSYVKIESGLKADFHPPTLSQNIFEPALLIPIPALANHFKSATIFTNDFVIGQDELLSDFFIDDSSVSSPHCKIIKKDNQFFLIDLHSDTGTFLNALKISFHQEEKLKNDDHIQIGLTQWIFKNASTL